MTTLPLPFAAARASEVALADLLRQRLEALQPLAAPGSPLEQEVVRLDQLLAAQGFTDALADDVERLAARIAAPQSLPLQHLRDTDEGQRLQQRLLARLRDTQDQIEALAAELQRREDGPGRLALGRALHAQLHEHRDTFRRALRANPEHADDLTGTGALLLGALDLQLSDLELRAEPARDAAQLPPPTGLRSIDTGRLLQRQQTAERSPETTLQGAALATGDGLPPDGPVDPAIAELLRARLASPDRAAPRPAQAAQLKQLDARLEDAARTWGPAYTVGATLRELLQTPASHAATTRELAEISALRANLAARLMEAATLAPQDAADLQRHHDRLAQQARALRDAADAGRQAAPDAAGALTAGLREDLQRLAAQPADLASRSDLEQTLQVALQRAQALSGDKAPTSALPLQADRASAEASAAQRQLIDALGERAALGAGAPDAALLQDAANRAAREQTPQRLRALNADRLLARASGGAWTAMIPAFTAGRVFVADATSEDDDGANTTADRRAFTPDAGLSLPRAAQRAARGMDAGALATEVHARHHTSPAGPDPMLHLGHQVARSLDALSGLFEAGFRSTQPLAPAPADAAAFAPRMSANMPNNIYADLSSARMQEVYLPALARIAGVSTPRAARPMASMSGGGGGDIARELSSPEALFFGLLGNAGERLQNEQPEVAQRLQASLKRVAEIVPNAGPQATQIIGKYATDMRNRVEGWLGLGAVGGIGKGGHDEPKSRIGQTLRGFGEHIGGILSGSGRIPHGDTTLVAHDQSAEVEASLRRERFSLDPSLVQSMERLFNRSLGAIEGFKGETAGRIAGEMGAAGFNVKNKMFFGPNTPGFNTSEGGGLLAHEMTHALLGNTTNDTAAIANEERLAYGVQDIVQSSNFDRLEDQMTKAFSRMELAKELNIPAARLPNEPGGRAADMSGEPSPTQTVADPAKESEREEQVFDAIVESVLEIIRAEQDTMRERKGMS